MNYQEYRIERGRLTDIGGRMQLKLAAIPLPDLKDKTVLDVGCDMGFWSFKAAELGALRVVGIDRNRHVDGVFTDLVTQNNETAKLEQLPCDFALVDLGKQWPDAWTYRPFDVVFCFSVYHHIFNNARSHAPVWYWLWQHCGEQLLWEGPLDTTDAVVQINVDESLRHIYDAKQILYWAQKFFDVEHIGPALHEPTREVYRMKPKPPRVKMYLSDPQAGAGGATKAFEYADGRRIEEIANITGVTCVPGSLNLTLDMDFDWSMGYYRAQVLDVKDRSKGFDSEWEPRWARFAPVSLDGMRAFAFRFEDESYPANFVELISDLRLRDGIRLGMLRRCLP